MNDTHAPDLGEEFDLKLNIPYTVCEILVAIFAVIGNAMVIIVFQRERRLRRRTNYYIVSLASADFLVGLLGIPFAILASVGLPVNIYACLFTVSLLVVLCTISIFCLVAVSVDRYWAILHPMGYSRNVRTKTALVIISICWIAGSFVGFLPLFGWHAGEDINQKCFFVRVMDYNYLVFLYFATIITPAILLAGFYAHIYRVVLKQLRRMVSANPSARTNGQIRIHGGKMLRMLGAAQKREVKATQNLSIIVLFFMICWIPLYTINCVQAFCSSCQIGQTFTDFCIILSHLNSAVNPLLYAYHLRDFRAALKHLIYNIFGIKDKSPSELDRNCRPSVNSNCSQYNRRPYLRNQPSTESLILYRNKIARNSLDASKKASVCLPIVSGTAMVAAASAGETGNREMWMIKEIPSASASAASEINGEREISIFPDGYPSVNQDISSESSSSGNINSGYVEGIIDDLEMGEDDVFYADASTFSANDYESDTSGILRKSDKNSDSIPTKKASKIWCLSSSSPQLSRSIFVVDNNVNNIKSSTTDKPLTIVDRKRPNLSVSGEFSPAKNLKLSPMRVVGEFLLHHNSNKCSKIYKKDEHSENNTNSVMIPDEEIKNNI